jgi:Fe2+ or Zn2+ uptake regulation protein
MEDIVDKTIKECVMTAVDDTLESLSDDGLIESVVNDNGEIAYRLKQ